MKKLFVFVLFLVVTLPSFSQKMLWRTRDVPLQTMADSLSYAVGNEMSQSLPPYLFHLGVLQDTAAVRNSYVSRIQAETSASKKKKIEKEMHTKLDSVNKANSTNLAEFIRGLQSAMNDQHKSPYVNGISVGNQITQTMLPQIKAGAFDAHDEVNVRALFNGLDGGLRNQPSSIPNAQAYVEMKKKNKQAKAGEQFLVENKSKPGVVSLPDGLQYKILKQGDGAIPKATDKVKVHYEGRLINGSIFDSSIQRGQPLDLDVSGVIKGWTEALQMMPVGSKWTLYIPYQLAYGENGPGKIGPYATLIFDVELLDIVKQ